MENKNTGFYILILTTGVIIISSLVEMMFTKKVWIEEKPIGYCGTVYEGIYGRPDSLNSEQEKIITLEQDLFEGNCTQCHSVNEKIVGPALSGLENHWENEEQLIEFVKYPEQTIQKNEYAKTLYDEYEQIMPNHDFFDNNQIRAILFYVKYMSGEKVYVEL